MMVKKEVPMMASLGLPGDSLGSSWGLPRKVSGQQGLPDVYETTLHSSLNV